MEKKTSSVEWLVEKLFADLDIEITNETNPALFNLIQQAKEKYREEIEEAYEQGCEIGEMFNNENRCFKTDAQKYYNETFKG